MPGRLRRNLHLGTASVLRLINSELVHAGYNVSSKITSSKHTRDGYEGH
jgi:hypothetical protein